MERRPVPVPVPVPADVENWFKRLRDNRCGCDEEERLFNGDREDVDVELRMYVEGGRERGEVFGSARFDCWRKDQP